MNELVKEIFDYKPLIYEVDGVYYAFGFGVCKCCKLTLNEVRLDNFEKAIESKQPNVISQIYNKVNFLTELIKYCNGIDMDPISKFKKYNFSSSEISIIYDQYKKYREVNEVYIIAS